VKGPRAVVIRARREPRDDILFNPLRLEYINQLQARGYIIMEAAREGAVLRVRQIVMTMVVAKLMLQSAAASHAIGSDSQRSFAIAVAGGHSAALAMGIFFLPALQVRVAWNTDKLPEPEESIVA
jgi:cobalt-zinc-cadmium resistance protein CzcA